MRVIFLFLFICGCATAQKPEEPKHGDCRFVDPPNIKVAGMQHHKVVQCYDALMNQWANFKLVPAINRAPANLQTPVPSEYKGDE